jgi:protein-tyrosine-phosphatase
MFHIYLLCTGNRCRSPIAEAAVRALAQGLPVTVGSGGLLELGPLPVLPEVLEAAVSMGLDVADHRARRFDSAELRSSDLVLGLERHHVATAIVDGGVPHEKAFTLREFVRLLAEAEAPDELDVPEERARALVAAAHETRVRDRAFVPGLDIADPLGGSPVAHLRTALEIRGLCRRVIEGMFGRPNAANMPFAR